MTRCRCRIRVTESSRRGGRAVVEIDDLYSGYVVAIAKVDGVTEVTIRRSGVERSGALGDWLSDTVAYLVTQGRGVTEYDLEITDDTVSAGVRGRSRAA